MQSRGFRAVSYTKNTSIIYKETCLNNIYPKISIVQYLEYTYFPGYFFSGCSGAFLKIIIKKKKEMLRGDSATGCSDWKQPRLRIATWSMQST